jgi:hypothetical protein
MGWVRNQEGLSATLLNGTRECTFLVSHQGEASRSSHGDTNKVTAYALGVHFSKIKFFSCPSFHFNCRIGLSNCSMRTLKCRMSS